MLIKYTIYPTSGEPTHHEIDWPKQPGYERIKNLIEPILDNNGMEHVTVLFNDQRRDMFVDEMGAMKRLPRNEAATAIYRANWLKQHPKCNPEEIAAIYGTAILFPNHIVWT